MLLKKDVKSIKNNNFPILTPLRDEIPFSLDANHDVSKPLSVHAQWHQYLKTIDFLLRPGGFLKPTRSLE